MWRSLIFWRLFGLYGALLLSAIGLLGIVIVNRVNKHNLGEIENALRDRAILIREMVSDRSAGNTELLQERVQRLRSELETRLTLLDDRAQVLADSDEVPAKMDNHAERPEVQEARRSGFGTATRLSHTVGQSMMYAVLRVDQRDTPVRYVRVALPLDAVQQQADWLSRVVGSTAAITSIAALGLAWWLARRFASPLQELTGGAQRIAAGDYQQKIYVSSTDEFGTLARSFNEMSQRLATQFAQLTEDRQQLRMILSGMVEGVVALDADERVLFANDRAGVLLEIDPQQATGRKVWELVRQRALQDIISRGLAEQESCKEELRWSGSNEKSLTIHAARLPGTPPRGAVLVLHDTTELRRLENLRREFVANVSHELKTPLSVIKACVETLLGGAVEDTEHRGPFLERIAEQADRLHALILDLINLARIESGEETFEFDCVPLAPVVAACIERYRARAEANHQRLEALPPTSTEAAEQVAVWVDHDALDQILDNLVDNALKYTPAGGRIAIRWRADSSHVRLEVEDTGIGIPDQDLPRIFERFYRVDKARSRQLGGTGLGLSIVKHLVQAMRGEVWATSRVGAGTTFSIELPRASVT